MTRTTSRRSAHYRSTQRLVASVATIVVLAGACGNDDDPAADSPTPSATQPDDPAATVTETARDTTPDTTTETAGDTTPDTTAETAGDTTPGTKTDTASDTVAPTDPDPAAFCTSVIEGEALFNTGPDTDEDGNPTPDGLEQFAAAFEPLLTSMEANAPDDLTGEVETVAGAVRIAIQTGDQSATFTQEFQQADAAVDAHVFDTCEFDSKLDIVAVNYAYGDVPATMDAGRVAIRMSNEGDEVHEAIIFRVNDGVEQTVAELLELPEEEAQELVEFKGAAFAGPGETGYAVVDFEPGHYAMMCFVPVGTTSLDQLESEGEGAPEHFTEGMVREFDVT